MQRFALEVSFTSKASHDPALPGHLNVMSNLSTKEASSFYYHPPASSLFSPLS